MQIEAIDLFCGVGGLTYGIQKSGIKVVAGLDLDESCKYAFEINNNTKFIHKDIKNTEPEELMNLYSENSIKLLMGCAPCQPFSRHQKDKKNRNKHKDWGLLYEFVRLIKGINPEIVSMENVPQLAREKVFKDFTKQLEELGYKCNYSIIDASDYGVPQYRRRLLFLGYKERKVEFIKKTHEFEKVSVREALGKLPIIKAGEQDKKDLIHKAANLTKINLERIRYSRPGGTWEEWPENLLPKCYKKKTGQTYTTVYGRLDPKKPANTITTQFFSYGTGRHGHYEQDRALSLREGAILQGFPNDYIFVENNEKILNTVIGRQIGNAVPPKLGEIIGESILKGLEGVKYG